MPFRPHVKIGGVDVPKDSQDRALAKAAHVGGEGSIDARAKLRWSRRSRCSQPSLRPHLMIRKLAMASTKFA